MIAACGGDVGATVKALLAGQTYLHNQIRENISACYSRRLPLATLDPVQGKRPVICRDGLD